nr:MAG TPA: hypothetical protein [Caudoviricetes sp.]
MINLLIGIALICMAIFVVVVAVRNTPANLQGFYGKFYCFIALVGVIAGIYLSIIGILSL